MAAAASSLAHPSGARVYEHTGVDAGLPRTLPAPSHLLRECLEKQDAQILTGKVDIPYTRVLVGMPEAGPAQFLAVNDVDAWRRATALTGASASVSPDSGKHVVETTMLAPQFHPAETRVVDTVHRALFPDAFGITAVLRRVEVGAAALHAHLSLSAPAAPSCPEGTVVGTLILFSPLPEYQSVTIAAPDGAAKVITGSAPEAHTSKRQDVRPGEPDVALRMPWAATRGVPVWSLQSHSGATVPAATTVAFVYDLVAEAAQPLTIASVPTLHPASLPFYQQLKQLLDVPDFESHAGVLGYFCNIPYGHVSVTEESLFASLKGPDAAVVLAAQALGCPVALASLLVKRYKNPAGPRASLMNDFWGMQCCNYLEELSGDEARDPTFEDMKLTFAVGTSLQVDSVIWLNSRRHTEINAVFHIEEEWEGAAPEVTRVYSAPVVLIAIPPRSARAESGTSPKLLSYGEFAHAVSGWDVSKPVPSLASVNADSTTTGGSSSISVGEAVDAAREPSADDSSRKAAGEAHLTSKIREALDSVQALFAVGGSANAAVTIAAETAAPASAGAAQVTRFPAEHPGATRVGGDMAALLSTCVPASFGRGLDEVLDPEYRSALRLDPWRAAVDWFPSNSGILSEVHKLLAPNYRAVRAELSKINVYETGGFFKPHLDTLRSVTMIGSLVVCLPTEFEGGILRLRHGPTQLSFDWSSTARRANGSESKLSWAAFFSDVEHEITPVTSGHRITLTYDLHGVPFSSEIEDSLVALEAYMPGGSASVPAAPSSGLRLLPEVDPGSFSLAEAISSALAAPEFMPEGGSLGIFCQHAYPHNSQAFAGRMNELLKGKDAIVSAALESLGLRVNVVSVHGEARNREEAQAAAEDAGDGDEDAEEEEDDEDEDDDRSYSEKFLTDSAHEDPGPCLTKTLAGVKVSDSWNIRAPRVDRPANRYESLHLAVDDVVRPADNGIDTGDGFELSALANDLKLEDAAGKRRRIRWLNRPTYLLPTLEVHHIMGNWPPMQEMVYSAAAILISVPPAAERAGITAAESQAAK